MSSRTDGTQSARFHPVPQVRLFVWSAVAVAAAALLFASSGRLRAEETYRSPDGKLTFAFPRRWQAETAGDRVRLTAPDGTHYFILTDTLSALPGVSPAANAELKQRATELVKPLLTAPEYAGSQPITMDHGVGATFRFHGPASSDKGPATSVTLGFVGKHSIVLIPERSGQSSQTIGLAAVMQSAAFADALPRPATPRTGRTDMQSVPSSGGSTITGPGTVSYAAQIAPLFKEKCEVCHRSTAPLGGFSVSSYADVLRGGRTGALILGGKPESSTLMDYLTGRRELMPKGGPALPADQIALIRKWIAEGARAQVGDAPTAGATIGSPATAPPGRERPARMRPGVFGGAGAPGQGATDRRSAVTQTAQLLEGYTGHLVVNDLGFTLRLQMDKSATAVWSLSPGRDIRYTGSYVGQDGNYVISLTQTGTPAVDQGKTITIELRSRGSQESGSYGLDGARPRKEIPELVLSESRAFDSTPKRPGQMRGNRQQNPRRPGR